VAVLAALETGSEQLSLKSASRSDALAVIDGQAVHVLSVRPLAAGLVTTPPRSRDADGWSLLKSNTLAWTN